MGVDLIGVYLTGVRLVGVSHRGVPYRRASHGHAPHRRTSHRHTSHERISHRRVFLGVHLMGAYLMGVCPIRHTSQGHILSWACTSWGMHLKGGSWRSFRGKIKRHGRHHSLGCNDYQKGCDV
jgi:hypothetical protein